MGLSLFSKKQVFPIGSAFFFNAFFDTIELRLCQEAGQSAYPVLFNDLKQGLVTFGQLDVLKKELQDIRMALAAFAPTELVWDKNDPTKQPPWGDHLSPNINSLANYFISSEGKDLFELLLEAIDTAWKEQSNLTIA